MADAPEHQAGEVAAAVRAERDEVSRQPARRLDDRPRDAAGAREADLGPRSDPLSLRRATTEAAARACSASLSSQIETSTTSASERRASATTTGRARSASPCGSSATRILRYMTTENDDEGLITMAGRPVRSGTAPGPQDVNGRRRASRCRPQLGLQLDPGLASGGLRSGRVTAVRRQPLALLPAAAQAADLRPDRPFPTAGSRTRPLRVSCGGTRPSAGGSSDS